MMLGEVTLLTHVPPLIHGELLHRSTHMIIFMFNCSSYKDIIKHLIIGLSHLV